jgi:lipopolysaccharide/colanic/teichoic acid biosynthesis glycosyltransferase
MPWKQLLDRTLAALLLVPGLPLIGLLVLLVRLTSRGPGVYSQRRVGKGGLLFTMYKLRSMRIDAEAATGPVWAGAGQDARVTRLGYWLRRLHLDELPQLFNVLRGEMSLVGPRPERPEFVAVLVEQLPGYRDRLRVRPGITGLAQVNLPPDSDLDSVRRKLALDCEYIDHASLLLDLRLILCTVLRVIGLRGGRSVRWLGLKRTVELPTSAAPIGGNAGHLPATPDTIVINQAANDTVIAGARTLRHRDDELPEQTAATSAAQA